MSEKSAPDPGSVRIRSAKRVGVLAALALGIYLVAFELLGYPDTYSCSEVPPEAADERSDYLPGAFAAAALFLAVLGTIAWRWAAERSRDRGRREIPGKLALGLAFVLGGIWVLILEEAMGADRVGGAVFYSLLAGLVGAGLLGVIALGLLGQLTVVRPTSENWERQADSMTTAAAWVLLLTIVPAMVVFIAAAGKDATIWC